MTVRKSYQHKPGKNHVPACVADHNRRTMAGLDRSPLEQCERNLAEALRVLAMAPRAASDFVPHPLDIVRAELANVGRYLAIAREAEHA